MADIEINLAQLKEYKAGEYQLIDIRNEDAFRYGSIKGAVNPVSYTHLNRPKDQLQYLIQV